MSASHGDECLSASEIEQYLAGEDQQGRAAAHVEHCEACQCAVREYRANMELLAEVRSTDLAELQPMDGTLPRADGYDILGELGRGGQGVVFRACQAATRRAVALKVLLTGVFATSWQRRLFEREIELVAGLSHPNIVTVYDSGVTRDGHLYFAMQYIEGDPLDVWMRRIDAEREHPGKRIDRRNEVIRLIRSVCDAVQHAHLHGIIHRDLKPGNILIDRDGSPHIVDFGLARLVTHDEHDAAPILTRTGQFMGTLAYAAPEQVTGRHQLVDVRSDVYALGVILYELLAGGRPFEESGDVQRTINAIIGSAPQPLTTYRSPRVPIDRDLETIVLKAMAREPDRRYQSAGALAEDLERYLSGEAISARRDSAWYVMRKTLKRHRGPVAAAAAFILMLMAFSASMFVLYQHAATEAAKVRQTNIFLEDTLGSVESVAPVSGKRDVTVAQLLDEAVEWIGLALGDQPEVAASIHMTIGNSYRALGLNDKAEDQLLSALELTNRLYGPDHVETARALNVLGLLKRDQGDLDAAESLIRQALEIRERRLGRNSYEASLALANLADVRRRRGDYKAAEQLLIESRSIREGLFGDAHPDVAMCTFNLAEIAEARGEIERARSLHEEALDVRRRVLDPHHPDLARSLHQLGERFLRDGNHAAAESLLRECHDIRASRLGERHWRTAETAAALGVTLSHLGRYEEAGHLLEQAIPVIERSFGSDDARVREAKLSMTVTARSSVTAIDSEDKRQSSSE